MEKAVSMRDIVSNTRKIKLHENFLDDGHIKESFCKGLETANCSYNNYVHIKSWMFAFSEKIFKDDAHELAYIACDGLKVLICNTRFLHSIIHKLAKRGLEKESLRIMGICCLTVASRMQQIKDSTSFNEILGMAHLNNSLNECVIRQIELDVFVALAHSGFCFEKTITPFNELNNIVSALSQQIHVLLEDKFPLFVASCNLMLRIIFCMVPLFNMDIYNYSVVNFFAHAYAKDKESAVYLFEKLKEIFPSKEIIEAQNFRIHLKNIIAAFKNTNVFSAGVYIVNSQEKLFIFQKINQQVETSALNKAPANIVGKTAVVKPVVDLTTATITTAPTTTTTIERNRPVGSTRVVSKQVGDMHETSKYI